MNCKSAFDGFILGLVQGLTEFLPVSSSGHLVLLEKIGVGNDGLFFNLALHLATLLAVVVFYRREIAEIIRHPLSAKSRFILTASVPTAIIAGLIRFFIPDDFPGLPTCFLMTSIILLLPKIFPTKSRTYEERGLFKRAVFTGIMQGIACFNGVSRSGSTVSAMKLCGFSDEESAEGSFLLSIPIILGSSLVEILAGGAQNTDFAALGIGAITAFAVGLCALKIFVKILKNGKIWIFSIYTFLMAIVSFLIIF